MNFVDEQDDPALLPGQVVEYGLHPFFEFAPVLRPCDQRTHVQCQKALALQAFRDLGVDNPLRQPFDDCGLSHPGFANQHRIVLGSTLQHLDGSAYLVVAPDDRIELALLGALGEIDGELLERPAVFLRVRIGHRFAAAYHVDGLCNRFPGRTVAGQEIGHPSVRLQAGEHEQFARYELVLSLLCELVAEIEVAAQLGRNMHVTCHAVDPRQRVERDPEMGP